MSSRKRCAWAGNDPRMVKYHDEEWGKPVHDEKTLFEFLILEGAQAGLSWQTVLNKRENYRKAFSGFDPAKIACYNERDITRLLSNSGIIRNRLKIAATIQNAKEFLAIQAEFGSFDAYVWKFVGGKPIVNRIESISDVPVTTKESDALSKDLLRRGFKFAGSTICYSFMQAVGLVNDHQTDCFRYSKVSI